MNLELFSLSAGTNATQTLAPGAVLLSGFASPIENMPGWLQVLTLANPVRHYLVIVKGLFLKDMPAVEVLRNLFPLVLIAIRTSPGRPRAST